MRRAACLLAILLAAAGCSHNVDPGQARICRLLPAALEAKDATIEMLSERPGEAARTVRVDYRTGTPERVPRQASVSCTFAGEGYAADRLDLVAVTHDGKPLSEIQLLVLKRWYLGSLEAAAEQGGGAGPPPLIALPLPPQAAYALQLLIISVPLASLEALLALAFALVYGLFGRILFGFGEAAVIGGYGAVLGIGLAVTAGISLPAAALPLALGAAVALGAVAGAGLGAILSSVLARGRGLALVVASVGLAIAIPEALRLAQGAADRWVQTFLRDPVPLIAAPGFSVTATPMQGLVAGVAIASMLGLALVMARTPAGRAWRAAAEDPGAAALFGVDLRRVSFLAFVASGALSGLAGFMLVANYGGIGFSAGLLLGLKALLAAVVGGVGSLLGAALAGALIGIVETVWSGYFALAYKDVAVLALLTLLLVLRPGGLLGFAERGPRPV